MEVLVLCIVFVAVAIGAYIFGYKTGEAGGFEDGMDAAIEIYEKEYRESKLQGMQMMLDSE